MLDGFEPWPDEFAQKYRELGYWNGEPLDAAMRRYGLTFANATAVIDRFGEWTYADLDHEIDHYAAGLSSFGIKDRDRVIVQLPNRVEFVVVMFALLRIGAIPVFALPAHRTTEIVHFAECTDAVAYVIPDVADEFDYRDLARTVRNQTDKLANVLVLGDPAEFTSLESLRQEPTSHAPTDPGDVAVLLMSGGTTGLPKFVARTHDDWSYSGRATAESSSYDTTTRHMVCLPLGHNWTLTHGLMATFHAGGTLVLGESPDPGTAFKLVEKHGVTDTGLVPGIALAWVEMAPYATEDLSSLRRVVIGGTKLAAELARRVEPALGCQLHQAFGMAEGLCGFQSGDDDLETRINAQGRPVSPADEIRVVSEAGDEVARGEVGQLLTRGPYTVRGYYRGGQHNVNSFTTDGFYRTGDLIRHLPNGQVVFEGRVKDQINRGGEKIAAEEVENLLLAHPAVLEVALVGIADEVLGECSCAYVVARDDAPRQAELARFLNEQGVAAFKIPDLVRVIDALPRTAIGKVDKKTLRSSAPEKATA
ncbi:(2,3-dihydroxybenzoyl)adenylate synthase [Antrihabitans stalactiti]|uniref:AMP-binding protein n=1 Tax=Antrihabitans stalactiti TaxID=2584121 RepID=A0A848KAA7_9NOCA|nr:AMP-binding protein [Antrihabitans stalactiti]NMN95269.1 AMP-binding protein [Antrihabitans stalactiti]